MGIDYKPNSILGFGFAVSLIVYYYGIYSNNDKLVSASLPFLEIFGVIWGVFILLTILRNVKKL